MVKKVMLFLGAILMVSVYAYAEEKCFLSGQVNFSGQEDIYISIYTIENFPNFKKLLPSPPFSQKIAPSPEQVNAGRLSFTFSGIPKGTYCIVAFQDVDNNGKLRCTTWGGVEEPICFYKTFSDPLCLGTWNDVKFELVRDITGIIMKLD